MSGPGGVFHCNDCGISFASAALLDNHRKRFCSSSRVDLAAKLMLESGDFAGPARPSIPGGRPPISGAREPSHHHAQSAPSAQQFNGSIPSNVYSRGAAQTPDPNMMAAAGGGGLSHMAPRSRSVEPFQQPQGPSPSSFTRGGPSPFQPSPGGALAGAPPYLTPSYSAQSPAPASNAAMQSDAMFRLLQEQQRQISMVQHQLAAANQAAAFGNGGAYGGDANVGPHHLRPGGNGMYNLGETPLPRYGPSGGMTVVEGRYGLRVYAAEGLRAFYTLSDRAPIELRIRQVYCRRRTGYYLPELEQRDEYAFATQRELAMERRNGYVNFGRSEYVFNVVSANEVVLVIELLCERRLVAWTEVLMDSLGEKVRRLRHPPIDVAGALRDFALRSTTATIGVEAFRARWDNMGYDGGDPEPEPTPAPAESTASSMSSPARTPPPPEPQSAPRFVPDPCDFYVDGIEGVPLNIDVSRIHVYLCEGETLGNLAVTVYQEENSPCAAPVFKCKLPIEPSPELLVCVAVECMHGMVKEVLGHANVPVPNGAPIGNYKSRLFRGEPQPDALLPDEDNPLDYPPAFFIKYRLHSSDPRKQYRTLEQLNEDEEIFIKDRLGHPTETPKGKGIRQIDMPGHFQRGLPPPTDPDRPRVYPNVTFLAPYNPKRGFFIYISHIRGMPSTRALHKIVVSFDGRSQFTKEHDYKSDIGCPHFRDAKFVFAKAALNPFAIATFTLWRFKVEADKATPETELIGHTYVPIFTAPFVRSGLWCLPWFAGPPQPDVLKKLKRTPAKDVITSCLEPPKHVLKCLEPKCTVTFAIGDPLRFDELTLKYETAPKPSRILFPDTVRHEFPYEGGRDGYFGHALSKVPGNENLVRFTERMNMILGQQPGVNT